LARAKGVDTLLIALTDGELAWDSATGDFIWHRQMPLPPALTGRFTSEPTWVDLTTYRGGTTRFDAKFIELAADLAAAIHGIPKDDFVSQDLRQHRRALALAWSAAASLLVLVALSGWQWWEAESVRRNSRIVEDVADQMVLRIAQDLRGVQGLGVEPLRRILDSAQAMMDRLAQASPDDVTLQRRRAAAFLEFATTYLAVGDLTRARAVLREALTIVERLERAGKLTAAQKDWPQVIRNRLAALPPEQAEAR
jgi:hypothetical protein